MSGLRPTVIKDADVFALTEKGNAELKATGTSLAATELQVLILIDGKTSVEQIGRSRAQPGGGRDRRDPEEIFRQPADHQRHRAQFRRPGVGLLQHRRAGRIFHLGDAEG